MADFRTQITSTRQLAISIQDARTAKDMTQTELAEATGIPRPWINQLEQGRIANPSFTKVLKIMDALAMRLSVSYASEDRTSKGHASDVSEGNRPSSMATTFNQINAAFANNLSHSLEAFSSSQMKAFSRQIEIATHPQIPKMNEQIKEILANFTAINPKISSAYSTVLERSRQVDQQARELEGLSDAPADDEKE